MEAIVYFIFIVLLIGGLYYQIRENPATMTVGTYGVFIVLFLSLGVLYFGQFDRLVWYRFGSCVGALAVIFGLLLLFSMSWYSWKKSRDYLTFMAASIYTVALIVTSYWQVMRWTLAWLLFYFVWQFMRFLISSLVYSVVTKAPKQGPIVVLGGGLVDGYKIGKIVDARIRAAVTDAKLMSIYPIIIFSGGQGEDELVSEAKAMRDWAILTYQVPISKTRLEDKSRNTYQNIKYSNQLLKNQAFTFYTSDYHVFRAVLLAQKQNVQAQGRGGDVVWRYRMTAFLREFAGVMSLNKWRHLCLASAWILIAWLINYL